MKTSVIDVRDLLSVWSVDGVEERIGKVPGVESVTVNFAAGSATVRYDETRLDVAEIKSAVRQSGYASEDESGSGQATGQQSAHNPAMNSPEPAPAASAHLAAVPEASEIAPAAPLAPAAPVVALTKAPSSTPAPTAPVPAPVAPAAAPAASDHKGHGGAAPGAQATMPAEMAKEMGHGGKDLPTMVRDMRNRFWICLIFTVPIFVYAPMADLFKPPAPPFGLKLNLWLFFLASAAILYPGWPFVVSAWRALRTRTFSMAVLVVLSVGTGYLFSVGSTFFFKGGRQFFEAASILLVFILLGHWLKMRARARASESPPVKRTVLK